MSKKLYIDADSLLYNTIYANKFTKDDHDGLAGDSLNPEAGNMKNFKTTFISLMEDVISSCELESAIGVMSEFKKTVLVFTGSTNFRYDIFPDYKIKRNDLPPKPPEFYKLKKWAVKKFGIISEIVEADDIVSYYAGKGHPIASADKDVLHQTVGYHYDMYYKCFVKTTKKDAKKFLCIQAVDGDWSCDGIPGLRTPKGKNGITKANPGGTGLLRVGPTKAETLLKGVYTLENAIQIYLNHNFTKEDAITQIRLVHMTQIKKINRKGKIKLEMYSEKD